MLIVDKTITAQNIDKMNIIWGYETQQNVTN